MWRDDLGSGSDGRGGGWRLDAYGTWVWDEPSLLERPGAGMDALRRTAVGGERPIERPRRSVERREAERRDGERRADRGGDRALAALDHADPTPIFHELTVDRSRPRREPRREARRDRDAVRVPEPHPGSGPLPVQDAEGRRDERRRDRSGLREVPTVPPPAVDGSGSASRRLPEPTPAETAEDELRRRAERRRRPRAAERAEEDEHDHLEGGRHTWRREEERTGRHALRR
ncbi:hypothetical protein [Actinomycetospora chlora]|uniref:hypothetical protein n=1 Tax=Actinomycetospora chlora TaxID=663608 RepID=UPI0031EAA1E4